MEISKRRFVTAGLVTVGLLLLGFIPWQASVRGPAWVHALRQTQIYTPLPARLVFRTKVGPVQKGSLLFQLHSPDIALEVVRSQALSDARASELRGLIGLEDGESQRAELQSQREKFQAEVKLYKGELSRLDLVASYTGKLQDVDDMLATGSWVHPRQPMGILIDPSSWVVDVLVEETDVAHVHVGDKADIWVLRSGLHKYPGRVVSIDTSRVNVLPHAMLDTQNGGPIATLPGDKHMAVAGLYKARVALEEHADLHQMMLGQAIIHTAPKAWLPSLLNRVLAVIVRESGF